MAAATPVLLFILGIVVARAARGVEQAQWANQKLIERRLELHKEMAPKLNDLFCFFLRVGHYKTVEPPDALARKRELDRTFHANAPLFDAEFATRYQNFIDVCFWTYGGAGEDARLRTSATIQAAERPAWKDEWGEAFAHGYESTEVAVAAAYDRAMEAFAEQVGVKTGPSRPRPWLAYYSTGEFPEPLVPKAGDTEPSS